MKYLLLMLVVFLFTGCEKKSYYGYVYDFDAKKPIPGMMVVDYLNSAETATDSTGFFSLPHNSKISGKFIFKKTGFKIDTVESIRKSNGEHIIEKFKGDTIYMFSVGSKFKDSVDRINRIEPTH